MKDQLGGGEVERNCLIPDGGVKKRWRAGDDPPAPPTDSTALLERFGAEGSRRDRYFVVRVCLAEASDEYALRVLEELRKELEVLGSTYTRDIGPDAPGVFDLLIEIDYDPAAVAAALVEPPEIESVTLCPAGAAPPDRARTGDGEGREETAGDETADDETVSEAIASAEAADEREDRAGTAPGDAEPVGAGAEEEDGSVAVPDSQREFERLKRDTDPVGYEELLAELNAVSMPGDFEDEDALDGLLEDATGEGEAGDLDESGTGDLDEPGTDDLDEPGTAAHGGSTATDAPGGASGNDDGTGGAAGAAGRIDPEDVVDALVTAIENDALGDEQRRTIAEGLEEGPPKTHLVRLDHLQREVDELTAYKEALEAFIEEYGSGEGLIEEVKEAIGRFESNVDDLANDIEDLRGRFEEVEGELDELDDLRSRLAEQESRLAELAAVDSRLEEFEERLGALGELEQDLDAVRREVDELAGADVESRLEAVESWLKELEEQVSALESGTAGRQEELADRLDEVAQRQESQEGLADRLDEVAQRQEGLTDRLDEMAQRQEGQEGLADRLDEMTQRQEGLTDRLDEMAQQQERQEEFADRLDEMAQRQEWLADRLDEVAQRQEGQEELADRVDATTERLEELAAWQDRITTVLAGSDLPDGEEDRPPDADSTS